MHAIAQVHHRVQNAVDAPGLEHGGLFLEGPRVEGPRAMVLDPLARVADTARLHRADPLALEQFSAHFTVEPMVLDAAGAAGLPHQCADARGDRIRHGRF